MAVRVGLRSQRGSHSFDDILAGFIFVESRQYPGAAKTENIISTIRSIELRFVEDLVEFVRGHWRVLGLSVATLADFFAAELKASIDKMFHREILVTEDVERKVSRAAETGSLFVRVRDLLFH